MAVVEVNRPDAAVRRRRGKTDAIDAEAAGRAVLAGSATAVAEAGGRHPGAQAGQDSAVTARVQAVNQLPC